MTPERDTARSDAEVRRVAAAFARPIRSEGLLQLFTTFGPFLAGRPAMYLVLPIAHWLTLALALPTGILLARIFIVQHDCGTRGIQPTARFRGVGASQQGRPA